MKPVKGEKFLVKRTPKKMFLNSSLRNLFLFTLHLSLFTVLLVGCDNMRDGNRLKPYEKSDFFEDKMSSRLPIEGTVARGQLEESDHLYRARNKGEMVTTFPFEIDRERLLRGQQRYNIYCAVCHDQTGSGRGMVVRRGFKQPSSFHEERLKNAPIGYFFDVITNGFGVMASYSAEIPAEDRWAIIAYIKTLQESQSVPFDSLSQEEKKSVLETNSSAKTNEATKEHHESH